MLLTGLNELYRKYQPDIIGVEQLFFNRNVTTAITVGQARGVILLTAQQAGIPILEFSPLCKSSRGYRPRPGDKGTSHRYDHAPLRHPSED